MNLGERRERVDGCAYCAELGDGFGPSHDASPNCESGGRAHCTCDGWCF